MTIVYRDGIGYRETESSWSDAEFDGKKWSEVDDGTMLRSAEELEAAVVGHRIVKVEQAPEIEFPSKSSWNRGKPALALTLDDGRKVLLRNTDDCCAYTELEGVIEHLPTTDHIITAVRAADDDFDRWHILADLGDVLELQVGWSCGNPFYYGYGFEIAVVDA